MRILLVGELSWGSQDVTGPGQKARSQAESQPQLGCRAESPGADAQCWPWAQEGAWGQRGPSCPSFFPPSAPPHPHENILMVLPQ